MTPVGEAGEVGKESTSIVSVGGGMVPFVFLVIVSIPWLRFEFGPQSVVKNQVV
jgi:hypothetical protein